MPLHSIHISAPTGIQFPNCIHKSLYSLGTSLKTEVLKIGSRTPRLVLALLQEKTKFSQLFQWCSIFEVAFCFSLALHGT